MVLRIVIPFLFSLVSHDCITNDSSSFSLRGFSISSTRSGDVLTLHTHAVASVRT